MIDEVNIGEASGMGDPAEVDMSISGEDVSTDDESGAEEPSTDKPADAPTKKSEAPEEDADDDDDADDENPERLKRTVPYSKLKAERTKNKELSETLNTVQVEMKTTLASIVQSIAELKAGNKTDDKPAADEIKIEADALMAELGGDTIFSGEDLEKVLRKAVELAKKSGASLPDDVKDKLAIVDEIAATKAEEQEKEQFNTEWTGFVPTLQKAYPNASPEMLAEAKAEMDKLAHSKEFHTVTDLEYIVFKNKKTFDTILTAAAKGKSGESNKQIGSGGNFEDTDVDDSVDIENLTPEIMKQREERSRSGSSNNEKDYRIVNPVRN